MDKILGWKTFFQRWPASIPKQGFLVTTVNESIPFCNFLVSETGVLAERDRPDNLGARVAIVLWQDIVTVKLTAPLEAPRFAELGFRPSS